MQNNMKTILIIVIVVILGFIIYLQFGKSESQVVVKNNTNVTTQEENIVGCYVATLAKDVYTININSQNDQAVEGTLTFDNFEKDSSSGTFGGTYKDGILLGEYSFQSEGMNSVMQVIFKKQGNDFVRGFGPVNATGDAFVDVNDVTYDTSVVFKATTGECADSL